MSEPYWTSDDGRIALHHGDCRAVLAELSAESVSCVVTSPPFWGLRKYDCPPSVWGGDAECPHSLDAQAMSDEGYAGRKRWQHHGVSRQETPGAWSRHQIQGQTSQRKGRSNVEAQRNETWQPETATCSLCGAWRGWYGLEPTVAMYVEHTVEVLRAIRRVLRPDGVVWWDLDDSRTQHGGKEAPGPKQATNQGSLQARGDGRRGTPLPDKSLCLIPQRVAIAAQEDGWIVRSEIIISTWMPESARDRPTDASRKVLMLTKGNRAVFWTHEAGGIRYREDGRPPPDYVWRHYKTGRETAKEPPNWRTLKDAEGKRIWARRNLWAGHDYWYDAAAVRVPSKAESQERAAYGFYDYYAEGGVDLSGYRGNGLQEWQGGMRNLGSVWEDLPPSNYPAAHFATFPVEEPERCIKASCPAEVCLKCGKARVRQIKKTTHFQGGSGKAGRTAAEVNASGKWAGIQYGENIKLGPVVDMETIGWTSCDCGTAYEAGLVLDPFIGTATTAVAAVRLGRRCIGIDLSEEYLQQAVTRLTVGDKGVRQMVAARRDGAEQGVLL